jgi:hypothetical protein
VKVQLTTVPGTSDWWQLCEFNVMTPGLARAGWIVSVTSTAGNDIKEFALDNNPACRWNSAESQRPSTS